MVRLVFGRVVTGILCLSSLIILSLSVVARGAETEHILLQAIRRGDTTLVQDLLRRGTPTGVRDDVGTTPLMVAALHGSTDMVELLLRYGADPNVVNDRGVTALLWGATDPAKVKLLIEHGADVNARSELGSTPLTVAAGSPEGTSAVRQLLDSGAQPTRKAGARSALLAAADGGSLETVRLLLEHARERDQLAELIDHSGPAVAVAANNGFHEIIKLLLEHGADPNRTTSSRGHGLNRALMAGQLESARTLIAHGADLDCRSQPGDTPTAVLAAYTELDDASMVELLKEHGVDFSAVSNEKETALTWARLRGHRHLADVLSKAGTPEGELPARPQIPWRSIDLQNGQQTHLIVEAVQKSIDLLQLSSDTFLDIRNNCVSCHHQNLPSVAIAWGRDRGFHVRQASLDRIIERQVKSWEPRINRAYELDSPFPVPPRFLGWGMWSFAELGYRPDELTRAVSWYLAATQQPDGRWVPGMLRPPLGGNEILATALGLRSLQLYPLAGREQETAARVDRARRWLENVQPLTPQDEVSRLLGLAWAGTQPQELADEVQRLLEAQREDGGWSQLPGLESDAWATGQTLVALHTAGGVPADDPAYRRGVEMLLSTQFEDGSWFVQARSWPFQPYFESRFPHGRDQWISAPATAWAVMALVLAVEPSDVKKLNPTRVVSVETEVTSPESPDQQSPQLVPSATRPVHFVKDIEPLLARSCLACHGEKEPKSNFSLTSRGALLRGGDSELPAIIPGVSHDSPLVRFAAGLEKKMEMPPLKSRDKYPALSDDELALLRAWIDQGAKWPDDRAAAP